MLGVEFQFLFRRVGQSRESVGGSVNSNLDEVEVHRETAFIFCILLAFLEQSQHLDTAGVLVADLRDETAVFVYDSAVQKPASVIGIDFHLVFYCGLGKVFSSEVVAEFVVFV